MRVPLPHEIPKPGIFSAAFASVPIQECTPRSDSDPRNLVILCTTQGIALQQDGQGTKKLFHHAVDKDDNVHRYWLEAERSNHKVGGAQIETKEEKQDAIKR